MNTLLLERAKRRAWLLMTETGIEQVVVESHWIDTWYEIHPESDRLDRRFSPTVLFRTSEHASSVRK